MNKTFFEKRKQIESEAFVDSFECFYFMCSDYIPISPRTYECVRACSRITRGGDGFASQRPPVSISDIAVGRSPDTLNITSVLPLARGNNLPLKWTTDLSFYPRVVAAVRLWYHIEFLSTAARPCNRYAPVWPFLVTFADISKPDEIFLTSNVYTLLLCFFYRF